MSNDEDNDLGYGKPPKSSQFTKGKSGNPAGRPKGSRNLNNIFQEILMERIEVKVNGKVQTMSKYEAINRQLTSQALNGDLKAIKEIFAQKQVLETLPEEASQDKPDREKNRAILKLLAKRLRNTTNIDAPSTALDSEKEQQ